LQALMFWSEGCELMKRSEPRAALAAFEKADELAPSGKIYAMDAVLALAALAQWQEVEIRLGRIYSGWQTDMRLPVALAMIGLARQNLEEAELSLRTPAEQIPEEVGQELLARLRNGEISEEVLNRLRSRFPDNWTDYVRDTLIAEEYFFVLLWKNRLTEAEQFANRMTARYQSLSMNSWKWMEKLGDTAFLSGNFPAALQRYEESLKSSKNNGGILLKLSDVYFRLGDLEKERLYREQLYGTLRQ
jgi:tetratricopeptide (TPR) repeat protein